MYRYRFRFSKTDLLRFISHLDLMRTMERALRRAKLPIALTQGFHPRPKLNFASALAVGVSSDDEYADVELTRQVAIEELIHSLNGGLPTGIRVLAAQEVPLDAASLMAIIDTATYDLSPVEDWPAQMEQRVEKLMEAESLQVSRKTKKGDKDVDVRPLIIDLALDENKLKLVAQSGSKGNLRPGEILQIFDQDQLLWRIHRTGLFVTQEGQLISPMNCL